MAASTASRIKVLEYDDKGDGVEAVNAYNLACDNGITAVFGATLTGTTIALADATYEDNMPQVTASATATGVTVIDPADPESEIRPNVFRACFIDPYQGEKMANYAVEKLSAKTAAVFYQTGNDYSEGLMNAFVAKAAELGLEIVDTEAFAEGDKDFKAQMTNIAAADPDVVFAPIYYAEAGLAITAAAQLAATQSSWAATASVPSRTTLPRKISKVLSTALATRPARIPSSSSKRITRLLIMSTKSPTCLRLWHTTLPCCSARV